MSPGPSGRKAGRRPAATRSRATKPGAAQPRGRPTKYSAKIAQRLCDKLADGVPISVICRAEDMPAARTVRLWQHRHALEFMPLILRAREGAAESLADQVLLIAENVTGNVARDRVRIAARM